LGEPSQNAAAREGRRRRGVCERQRIEAPGEPAAEGRGRPASRGFDETQLGLAEDAVQAAAVGGGPHLEPGERHGRCQQCGNDDQHCKYERQGDPAAAESIHSRLEAPVVA
jgi:hypothetical protein